MERTEYWIRPGQGKAIALIHGIGATDPQAYWRDFLAVLMQDEHLHEFGVFVWKYPTHVQPGGIRNALSSWKRKTLRETTPRIALLGSAWSVTYRTQFQGYQDVVLVCHSMGGLVVKSWILQMLEQGQSKNLATVRHIAFYATPHQGAPMTTLARWNKQLKDMQLDSPFIEDVDRRWHDHVVTWKERPLAPADAHFNGYIPHLVLAGLNDAVVPSQYATIRGMPLATITGDHSQVIQPIDSNDTRYRVWRTQTDEAFANLSIKTDVSSPPIRHELTVVSTSVSRSLNRVFEANSTQTPVITEKTRGIDIYISFADEDNSLRQELEKHLSSLMRQGYISQLHHHSLRNAGVEWLKEAWSRLNAVPLILLLVSIDFLASEHCYSIEMRRAMERHEVGEARIVPVIVRPVSWDGTPFDKLRVLPTNGIPVVSSHWFTPDEAWLDVVEGIRAVIAEITATPHIFRPPLTSHYSWNIPYDRNAVFSGRDQHLNELHTKFTSAQARSTIIIQAITGMGGIGKTQIAIEYAYRNSNIYRYILWVNAAKREILINDFEQLAIRLKLPVQIAQDPSKVVDIVKNWLSNQQDWLFILDNVDDIEMLHEFLPTRNQTNGHLLLTTQERYLGTFADMLHVQKMNDEGGALLLLRRANLLSPEANLDQATAITRDQAASLVKVLDGLPLALDQAGAYILETSSSLAEYLTLYEIQKEKLLERRGRFPPGHPDAVITTLNMSIEKVKGANLAAEHLLYLCAFLDAEAIPEAIFSTGAKELGDELEPVASDVFALKQAIEVLLRRSLMHRDSETRILNMHRLVQDVVKFGMPYEMQRIWAERAVRAVTHVFLRVNVTIWPECQHYIPQVQTCLTLLDHYDLAFPEAVRLLTRAGFALRTLKQYDQAEVFYKRALETVEKTLGSEHQEVATCLNNLASFYSIQSQNDQAEVFYKRALEIRAKTLGPEHPSTTVILEGYTTLLRNMNRKEEAITLLAQFNAETN